MITNFFRLELPFDSFQIQRLPFSEEKWLELKEQYNRDVSFFRNGDFMYLSPSKESGLELGDLVQLTVAENPTVVQSLIRDRFEMPSLTESPKAFHLLDFSQRRRSMTRFAICCLGTFKG